MKKHYTIMCSGDFARPITISRSTDLYDSEAEADGHATRAIEDGAEYVYLYELKRLYRPTPNGNSRDVEEIFVEPIPF